jgi:hypothetical protein
MNNKKKGSLEKYKGSARFNFNEKQRETESLSIKVPQ